MTSIGEKAFHYYKTGTYVHLDIRLYVYKDSYAYEYAISNGFSYSFIKPDHIAVTHLPAKLTYDEAKEALVINDGVVAVYYDNGTYEEIPMTADMISGFDKKHMGAQLLAVTYEGQTATFGIMLFANKMKADLDGDGAITVSDALIVLRIAARLSEPSNADQFDAGNMDGDGAITVGDALIVLRIAARLVVVASLG